MTIEFNSECANAARALTKMSLQEDLHDVGDLTSLSTIPAGLNAAVNIVSRQSGVVCGLTVLPIVFSGSILRWSLSITSRMAMRLLARH